MKRKVKKGSIDKRTLKRLYKQVQKLKDMQDEFLKEEKHLKKMARLARLKEIMEE
jgi:hypothetical protein